MKTLRFCLRSGLFFSELFTAFSLPNYENTPTINIIDPGALLLLNKQPIVAKNVVYCDEDLQKTNKDNFTDRIGISDATFVYQQSASNSISQVVLHQRSYLKFY